MSENLQLNVNNLENSFSVKIHKYDGYDKFLFDENGGFLHSTVYFKYIAASYAKNFFRNLIEKLDVKDEFFVTLDGLAVDPNLAKIAHERYKLQYAKNIKAADAEKEQWKKNHMDFYRMQPCLPSSVKYESIFNFSMDDINLEQAIQGYKSANEVLKSIDNSSLDKYCIEIKPMLNYEHRVEYRNAMDAIDAKYGLKTKEEIEAGLPMVKKKRLSLSRSKCENWEIQAAWIQRVKELLEEAKI